MKTSDHVLQGFQSSPASVKEGPFASYMTWSMSVPQSEFVHSIIRAPDQPIASLGRVLGNRTTLYKYLNPHLFAVTTVPRSPTAGWCSIYLVDGVKGSVIYHVAVAAKGTCGIEAVLTENWLVYSYYDDEYIGVGQSKGHRVISVELYEGNGINDKTRRSVAIIFT
jgi:ER membrane protein complex subunit 1